MAARLAKQFRCTATGTLSSVSLDASCSDLIAGCVRVRLTTIAWVAVLFDTSAFDLKAPYYFSIIRCRVLPAGLPLVVLSCCCLLVQETESLPFNTAGRKAPVKSVLGVAPRYKLRPSCCFAGNV